MTHLALSRCATAKCPRILLWNTCLIKCPKRERAFVSCNAVWHFFIFFCLCRLMHEGCRKTFFSELKLNTYLATKDQKKKILKMKSVSLSGHIKTAMDYKECVSLIASATWRCRPSLAPARWRRMCCSTASIGKASWMRKISSWWWW